MLDVLYWNRSSSTVRCSAPLILFFLIKNKQKIIIFIFRRKSPQTLLAAEAHRQVFKNHLQLVTFWMLNVILMWVNTGLWKCNIECLDEMKTKCKACASNKFCVGSAVQLTAEQSRRQCFTTQPPLDDSSVPQTFSKVKETLRSRKLFISTNTVNESEC